MSTNFRPPYPENLNGYVLRDDVEWVLHRESRLLHSTRCPSMRQRPDQLHDEMALTDPIPAVMASELFIAYQADPGRPRGVGYCGVNGCGLTRITVLA